MLFTYILIVAFLVVSVFLISLSIVIFIVEAMQDLKEREQFSSLNLLKKCL